jgi:cobalt/nickel transport system permease protein
VKHAYLDQYSNIPSIINRLDSRVKLIASVIFILTVILTPPDSWTAFLVYGGIITILILFSRIPPLFILKRSLAILPFVLMTAVFIPFIKENGGIIFRNIIIKSFLSILCMTLLVSSTKFYSLLKSLEWFKIPKSIIMILSFMYRYIFVVYDGLLKMKQARDSRLCCSSRWLHMKTNAFIIANLFIKTYERAEAVYLAMCARGFDGTIKTYESCKAGKNEKQ